MRKNEEVFIEWRDGMYYAWCRELPYVQAVDVTEDDAVTNLTAWYANNHPSIYHGLPVMAFWWIFTEDPYHVYIAEHKYDEIYDSVFDWFLETYGDPPQQVSAWSPEIQIVYPLEKLRFTLETNLAKKS